MAYLLIVDDEPTHRQIAEIMCRRMGHDVATAADGETAWALMGAERFDLAVVDMMMPGLDGPQLVQRMRQHPDTAALPVLALTAAVSVQERAAMAAAGVAHVVAKPFNGQSLQAAIAALLPTHDLLIDP
jgi:CheY-like chemotaxis protein